LRDILAYCAPIDDHLEMGKRITITNNHTNMKTKNIFFLAIALVAMACGKQPMKVTHVESIAIPIDSSLDAIQDTDYYAELRPYQEQMDNKLSTVIGHTSQYMSVGTPESPMLNWSCDALKAIAEKVFDTKVDLAIVNVGGLRCEWLPGDLSIKSCYELMPFDNELVLVSLKGSDLKDLAQAMAVKGGEGISGMTMEIQNGQAKNVLVGGKEIVPEAIYKIATSDYLAAGNDYLDPLGRHIDKQVTGMFIRDLYIEYIKQTTAQGKEVEGVLDGRTKLISKK